MGQRVYRRDLWILRENQQKFLDKLEEVGCKTLVSNDYDEICRATMEYFS